MLLLRKFKAVFKNEELRLYFGIAAGSVVLIAINISRMYNTVCESVHHAAFQVVSIMTTTGYGTVDFEQWPAFSKATCFRSCSSAPAQAARAAVSRSPVFCS